MTRHNRTEQKVRHYISPTVFVGACGQSSLNDGHAITGLPAHVSCPACKEVMQAPTAHHPQDNRFGGRRAPRRRNGRQQQ